MELELNSETVRNIIEKTYQFQMKDGVITSDEPPGYADDGAPPMLADHVNDPIYRELKYTIDDLEPDQQQMLVAIMWIGRGDFAPDEWAEAFGHARDSWTERTADYVIGTAMAADYLREGLDLLAPRRNSQ